MKVAKLNKPGVVGLGMFIPGTAVLLSVEWSWKDTWITPHIGLTSFSNYRTLRIGWLPLAFGVCWPKKESPQEVNDAKES